MIKEQAINLSNKDDFIASKGWLDKFKVRYKLEISKESSRESHKRQKTSDSSNYCRKRGKSMMPNYPVRSIPFAKDEPFHVRRSINKSIKQEGNYESDENKINQEQNSIHVLADSKVCSQLNTTIKEECNSGPDFSAVNTRELGSIFDSSPNNINFQNEVNDLGNNKISNPLGEPNL